MFLFKSKRYNHSEQSTSQGQSDTPEVRLEVPSEVPSELPSEPSPAVDQDNLNSVTMESTLSKMFFRNQKHFLTEGPDTPFENETWAPDRIGLFRKHRATFEEQSSSVPGPQ